MGIFGDELLLNLIYEKNEINKPSVRIKKIKPNPEYLIPFSCVSLLLSQLTVLTDWPNVLLATSVINFIQNPKNEYKLSRENCVLGFELSLFKKNSNFIYNQFDPLGRMSSVFAPSDMVEREIAYILYNYFLWVYDNLPEREKKFLCVHLLLALNFYKTQLQPIIEKISTNGVLTIEQRKKIIGDQVSISSMIYNKWHNPPFLFGTPNYEARIDEMKSLLNM